MSLIVSTELFVRDTAERAAKTFVQAAVASVGSAQLLSAIHGAEIHDYSIAERVGASAVLAGAAAVLSLFTSLLSAARTSTASSSKPVAAATAAADAPVDVIAPAVPSGVSDEMTAAINNT